MRIEEIHVQDVLRSGSSQRGRYRRFSWAKRSRQDQVPGKDYQRVKDAINSLAQEPRPRGCSKLVAREGWRIRVGDYRVIYEIDDSQQVVRFCTWATGAIFTVEALYITLC